MDRGAELEVIVETIVRQLVAEHSDVTVQRGVLLDGPDGPRQIDVLVKAVIGPFDLTIVLECKDYRRKVDVTTVDALHSVLHDVGANMGVLVSRNGFSNAARHKAKRTGITLLEADRLSSLALGIPMYVRELQVSSVRTAMDVEDLSLTDGGDVREDERSYVTCGSRYPQRHPARVQGSHGRARPNRKEGLSPLVPPGLTALHSKRSAEGMARRPTAGGVTSSRSTVACSLDVSYQ